MLTENSQNDLTQCQIYVFNMPRVKYKEIGKRKKLF